jgi:drug/metabolite transporter (DMT)-like permease
MEKVVYLFLFFINPWVLSSVIATFFAGLSWIFVMSRFDIGFAYPFICLNMIVMMWVGVLLFGEPITISRVIGTLIICIGLTVVYKGE